MTTLVSIEKLLAAGTEMEPGFLEALLPTGSASVQALASDPRIPAPTLHYMICYGSEVPEAVLRSHAEWCCLGALAYAVSTEMELPPSCYQAADAVGLLAAGKGEASELKALRESILVATKSADPVDAWPLWTACQALGSDPQDAAHLSAVMIKQVDWATTLNDLVVRVVALG